MSHHRGLDLEIVLSSCATRRGPWAAWLLVLALWAPALASAERLALVIGNRDYTVGALKNPVNDALAIDRVLRSLGFKVTLVQNLKRDDIGRTIDGFAAQVKPGDDVVVFYAGHGIQVKGINYLPAVDAAITTETDVPLNSIHLNGLVERIDEAKAGVRIFLIDACRDNPYGSRMRSTAQGLARMESAPSGTLMHFATRPGGVAFDGSGEHGLYTKHLLDHLGAPGLPVESVLKRVATSVRQASDGQQQPWTEGALDGDFYFVPPAGAADAAVAERAPAAPPAAPAVATAPPVARAGSAEPPSPPSANADPGKASLLRFQGIVFEVSGQRMVVRSVPAGRRIGVRPGDEVLGCQQGGTLVAWDQLPLVTGSLGPRCKPETTERGRSHYVLSIRRDGETMLRAIAANP